MNNGYSLGFGFAYQERYKNNVKKGNAGGFYNYADSISNETYNDQVLFKRTNQFGEAPDEYLSYQNHFGLTTDKVRKTIINKLEEIK